MQLIQDVKCNVCKQHIATVRENQAEPEWMEMNAVFLSLMTWPVLQPTAKGGTQGHPMEEIALCETHGKSLKAAIRVWWKKMQEENPDLPVEPPQQDNDPSISEAGEEIAHNPS
jgi:hypothetical protein